MDDTKNKTSEYKQIIVDILKGFIDFCEKNDLRYFLAYGSAIGAVRHHGMIPWDDDIDVVMPRGDYEKFLKLFPKLKSEKYEIINVWNNRSFYMPFSKLCVKNTTLLEKWHFKCVIGAYIDIFPLDVAPDEKTKQLELTKKLIPLKGRLYTSGLKGNKKRMAQAYKEHNYVLWICFLFHLIPLLHYFTMKKIRAICMSYADRNTSTVASYCGAYGEKEFFPKEWFEGFAIFSFENINVKIPADYDSYLRHLYGDYMKLPPEEERCSQHTVAYLNLKKKKTLGEIYRDTQVQK